jgi:hypothetical protein
VSTPSVIIKCNKFLNEEIVMNLNRECVPLSP